MNHNNERAFSIARDALLANVIEIGNRKYLVAGQNQFKTLWTRDFCFSVRGLLKVNGHRVVEDHLTSLLEFRRPTDGLIPRVIDHMAPRYRVIWNSLRRHAPYLPTLPLREPLRPEYTDEHGTEAIDSNLLFLIASFQFVAKTENWQWLKSHERALLEVFLYIEDRIHYSNHLLWQPAFSDWQDSTKREGFTFYTNVLHYCVLSQAHNLGLFGVKKTDVSRINEAVLHAFMIKETNLCRDRIGNETVALDSHLLALDCGFFGSDAPSIYQSLKKSTLWSGSAHGLPGFVSNGSSPSSEKTLAVRMAGLQNYHEDIYWSWLIAYAALVARDQKDLTECSRIQSRLAEILERDGTVYEIYSSKNLEPVRTRLYSSEAPFSWGASFMVLL